ncbi:2-C-methyl-D-erythritol 4-phosphate cytidylyltransferase [Kineococcus gynurae]|uniref:2-C-methyl-D-erythritol 4-phosphate cytidylyltransferase n=1 Tax=Kineococcus gynurae TaxID=452979 RepID=UPI0035ECAD1F
MGLVVPAAGRGDRLAAGRPKAFVLLAGEPLLVHAVRGALSSGVVDVVVVVVPAGMRDTVLELLAPLDCPDLRVVVGGGERQDSVRAGVHALPSDVDGVLVHDAARSLAPPRVFVDVVAALEAGAVAVVPTLAVSDTIKRVVDGVVVETVDRRELAVVQTPQGFRHDALHAAHEAARGAAPATDDAGILEALGHEVRVVPGAPEAIKITLPQDLLLAEVLVGAAPTAPVAP